MKQEMSICSKVDKHFQPCIRSAISVSYSVQELEVFMLKFSSWFALVLLKLILCLMVSYQKNQPLSSDSTLEQFEDWIRLQIYTTIYVKKLSPNE